MVRRRVSAVRTMPCIAGRTMRPVVVPGLILRDACRRKLLRMRR
jgi:hypothetical protein